MLHKIVTAVRMLEAALYHFGPGILAKYTMLCARLIGVLCVAAALVEAAARRPITALLWVAMAALLYTGFWFETTLYGRQWSATFGLASGFVALWLLIGLVWREVRDPV